MQVRRFLRVEDEWEPFLEKLCVSWQIQGWKGHNEAGPSRLVSRCASRLFLARGRAALRRASLSHTARSNDRR